MAWDDTQTSSTSIDATEWNNMVSYIKGVIANTTTATSGSILNVTRNLSSASTDNAVAVIIQDNASDDQQAVYIKQDGTGEGILLDQNGSGIAMFIDHEDSGSPAIRWDCDATAAAGWIGDITDASATYYFARNAASADTASYVAWFRNQNSGDDQEVMAITQEAPATGLFIDQNGNGTALNIDSEATSKDTVVIDSAIDNDFASLNIKHGGTAKFGVLKNTDLSEDVCLRLGSYYLWVDTNGDLRIQSGYPSSDTGGTVVGTQS